MSAFMKTEEPPVDALPAHTRALLTVYESVSRTRKLSHHERAGFENEIWESVPRPMKASLTRPFQIEDFVKAFSLSFIKPMETQKRRSLFLGGEAVSVLWARVDAEHEAMPLATATRLWQKAKTIAATSGHSRVEAVQIAISEYERMPVTRMANGNVVRKPKTSVERTVAAATGSLVNKGRGQKKKPATAKHGREVFVDLKKTVSEYLIQRAVEAGADPSSTLVMEALQSLGIEIDILSSGLSLTIKRIGGLVKADAVAGAMISTRRVNTAFRTLNLEPPDRGDEIDMKLVRLHKRRLARQYHPDAHGGKTDTVEKYEAVIEAFDIIEAWVAQHPGLAKGE